MGRIGMTADEDAELRRLHYFRRFGVVATRFADRYNDLRGRDRRRQVRDPEDRAATGQELFSPQPR